MSIWKWSDWIATVPESSRVSLGEGGTPVVRSRRIGPQAGLRNLWFKLEQSNPSASYKDRFASAAISHMVAAGQTKCAATSSGNTGAALAAYCAAAGIECRIAIVEGAPPGKLRQMMAYGARIARIRRFGTDAETTGRVFERLNAIGQQPGWALQISAFVFSPLGMSGVQTISYEMAEQLDSPIDHVFCQAGGGGLCVAVARGFQTLVSSGRIARSPTIECVQPEGNNTISGALREGSARAREVTCTSKVSGLQVPTVIDGDLAISACVSTGGTGHLVSDEFVWELQKRMALEEGIFCEPAAATGLAGVLQAMREGRIRPDATVVCLVTGSGFKDEASVDRMLATAECPLIDPEALSEWQ